MDYFYVPVIIEDNFDWDNSRESIQNTNNRNGLVISNRCDDAKEKQKEEKKAKE